jgi:Ser/Thr protein kinase RdoA (MazF antagonist)
MTYTELSMIRLNPILQAYFPGSTIKDGESVSGGLINDTYRVKLEDSRDFILQKLNTDVFKDVASIHSNTEKIGVHLKANGYSYEFPTPIKTYLGKNHHVLGNDVWRVLPYIRDSYSTNKVRSYEMAKNAGKCLGHLHANTTGMDLAQIAITIPHFHSGKFRVEQFENAVLGSNRDGGHLVQEISNHLQLLHDWDKTCLSVPTRVAHFDTKIENFLFKNGTEEVVALIDLDTLMPGSILSDVGDMIRSFSDPGNSKESTLAFPRLEYRDALITGYLSEMNDYITEKERSLLKFSGCVMTLMQSLRFLTDHLIGDVYYHIEYEGQNLERAKHQFTLYQHFYP